MNRTAPQNHRVDIGELFRSLEERLAVRLDRARGLITHGGAKGSASETSWIGAIAGFLPPRYLAAKGFVINADEYCSDEIDIIVFDRDAHPLVLDQDGVQFIPVEAVRAVLEVKQEANAETINCAGAKAASVRR